MWLHGPGGASGWRGGDDQRRGEREGREKGGSEWRQGMGGRGKREGGTHLGRRAHTRPALEPDRQGRALGLASRLKEPEEDVLLVRRVLRAGGEPDVSGVRLYVLGRLAEALGLFGVSGGLGQFGTRDRVEGRNRGDGGRREEGWKLGWKRHTSLYETVAFAVLPDGFAAMPTASQRSEKSTPSRALRSILVFMTPHQSSRFDLKSEEALDT